MREISLSPDAVPPAIVWPIHRCVSRDCLQKLIDYHHSKYRKRLAVEDWVNPPSIMPFDAAAEMGAPDSADHMRPT